MRIGLVVPQDASVGYARRAEEHGLFGVVVLPGTPGEEMLAAAEIAANTSFVRIVVTVPLGSEHPVTLAEELAVLDNISTGRVVAILDTADLDADAAGEDAAVIRQSLLPVPIRHRGVRWRIPSGLDEHEAPERIQVTPETVQVELPLWLVGNAAGAVATALGLPVVASTPEELGDSLVRPARELLVGELEGDRERVVAWSGAGATHLFLELADRNEADPDEQLREVSRFLIPETAMPHYPRIISESPLPARWPGSEEGDQ